MRIGILTFHLARNYGAVLQAYALQEYLHDKGHSAEIIDYRTPVIENRYKLAKPAKSASLSAKLKHCLISAPRHYFSYSKIDQYFKEFREEKLNISSEIYDKTSIENSPYDLFIFGSDQIWNTLLTKGFDDMYWGNFTTQKGAQKISYAASSSFYDFPQEQQNQIVNALKTYKQISVREDSLKNYLKENLDINCECVLDPTLMVEPIFWENLAIKPKATNYITTYFAHHRIVQENAKLIAQQKGLKIKAIYYYLNVKNLKKLKTKLYRVEEFLGMIKYADFVVCSSFHGLAFSLIFNKEFCFVGDKKSNVSDRALSLLKKLDLEDRFVENAAEITSKIDYSAVNAKLKKLRKSSQSFLDKNISEK